MHAQSKPAGFGERTPSELIKPPYASTRLRRQPGVGRPLRTWTSIRHAVSHRSNRARRQKSRMAKALQKPTGRDGSLSTAVPIRAVPRKDRSSPRSIVTGRPHLQHCDRGRRIRAGPDACFSASIARLTSDTNPQHPSLSASPILVMRNGSAKSETLLRETPSKGPMELPR